ncbi:hypothetical protein [Streptomyces chartreusis]|uniref:hypothetical protein n=1 Tax=Streptomyces chartreusis TaxID=1969 RepID=UPI003418B011
MTELEHFSEGQDPVGLSWGLMLAHLQNGDLEAAEHWLEHALRHQPEGMTPDAYAPDLGARGEIALARGDIETGLGLWRRAVARMERAASPVRGGEPLLEGWRLELQAVALTAHARHGRTDLVAPLAGALPERLTTLLIRPSIATRPTTADLPVQGALLLALGTADLAAGDPVRGVRLIALADGFRCLRNFQPTMSSARARQDAENADRAAHADAMAEYAGLAPDALREAALGLLGERTG